MTYEQLTYQLNKLARETQCTNTQTKLLELASDLEKNGLSDNEYNEY